MEDHRAPKPARAAAVSASASRVWITTGKPSRRGQLELAVEERPLRGAGCEIVEVVEPRLADGNDAGWLEQLGELLDPRRLGPARLVRVDPERSEDALLRLGDRERRAAGRRSPSRS